MHLYCWLYLPILIITLTCSTGRGLNVVWDGKYILPVILVLKLELIRTLILILLLPILLIVIVLILMPTYSMAPELYVAWGG